MENQFEKLGLSESFVKNLKRQKITEPTEIQEKAIPSAIKGQDIVGISATGSGKTLVFASAIIKKVEEKGFPQALVLTPTRELAEQVASAIRKFQVEKFKVFTAYGGIKIDEHLKKIRDADLIIAAPGRLRDLLERGAFSMKTIHTLVLDEFDRMLDMGFKKDVNFIIEKCPEERQTLLFSATTTKEIEELIREYTKSPKKIEAKAFVEESKLEQVYYKCDKTMKLGLLVHLMKQDKPNSAIVFCSTQLSTELVSRNLVKLGILTETIHGGMEQKKRTNALKRFHRDGGILICTDVAARGLDIENVDFIYNYDLPSRPEDYIHRVGRTARAGKKGKATTLLTPRDYKIFEEIIKLGVKIDEMESIKVEPIKIEIDMRKLKKPKNPVRKSTGEVWHSIEDPALSNRFKKRTVAKKDYDEDDKKSNKKTRRAGAKVKKQGRGKSSTKSKIAKHIPAKGKRKKTGRAGNRTGTRKISKRGKGRANRKTKK